MMRVRFPPPAPNHLKKSIKNNYLIRDVGFLSTILSTTSSHKKQTAPNRPKHMGFNSFFVFFRTKLAKIFRVSFLAIPRTKPMNLRTFLFAIAAFTSASPLAAQSLHVRDADTIEVSGTPVRLNGVDAPELGTKAGRDAKRWMVNYLRGKSIECDLNGERTHDRWVGVCYADGEDIGAAVIKAGHALDCRRYSGGRYQRFETAAAQSRIKRASYCR